MKSFVSFLLTEQNTHLTHLEDLTLDGGVNGTRQAINYLQSLRDMLVGSASKSSNISVKFDGAPAIIFGKDPEDGKYFVATKGLFNKVPKYYKTEAEVDAGVSSSDLATKLKTALQYLPSLNISYRAVQGDFLFTREDLKQETVGGEPSVVFHPNTIAYAVPLSNPLSRKILAAKMGIVWHTSYSGSSLENLKPSYNKNLSNNIGSNSNVWSVSPMVRDLSGTATFTRAESIELTNQLRAAGSLFQRIPASLFNEVSGNDALNLNIHRYNNKKIREGDQVASPADHVEGLVEFLTTDEKALKSKAQTLNVFVKHSKQDLINLFQLRNALIRCKEMVINKLNTLNGLGTFLKTSNGYQVTGHEGFVISDKSDSSAVKLVNRLEFSRANFSSDYIKGFLR